MSLILQNSYPTQDSYFFFVVGVVVVVVVVMSIYSSFLINLSKKSLELPLGQGQLLFVQIAI